MLYGSGSSRGQVFKGTKSSRIVSPQRFWVFKGLLGSRVLKGSGSFRIPGSPRSWDLLNSSESWVLCRFYMLITKKWWKFHQSSFVKLFCKAHRNTFFKREEKLDIGKNWRWIFFGKKTNIRTILTYIKCFKC